MILYSALAVTLFMAPFIKAYFITLYKENNYGVLKWWFGLCFPLALMAAYLFVGELLR
jgi:hypothetical protein